MNRRSFSKYLGAVAFIPSILKPTETIAGFQNDPTDISTSNILIPDVIAGRTLSEEEKMWMAEFFKNFDESMKPIRATDLPHDLMPAFIPKYPPKKSRRKTESPEE